MTASLATTFALCFALCCALCHVAHTSDLSSMLSVYLARAGCGAVEIAETNQCIQEAFHRITGHDACANFGMFSPCWPRCYCESPKGFRHLVDAYKPQCRNMPPCGAALGGSNGKKDSARAKMRERAQKRA